MSRQEKGPDSTEASTPDAATGWFNRNVIGMGLTSLFGDMSYEMANSILPLFIVFSTGAAPRS